MCNPNISVQKLCFDMVREQGLVVFGSKEGVKKWCLNKVQCIIGDNGDKGEKKRKKIPII